jgi:hypothetical protein
MSYMDNYYNKVSYSYSLVKGNLEKYLIAQFGKCPHTGQGVNAWVCKVVDSLLAHGAPADDVRRVVRRLAAGCGRSVDQDISHAIETAAKHLGLGTGLDEQPIPYVERQGKYDWPERSLRDYYEALKWADGTTAAEFEEVSPVGVADLTSESVLPVLYPDPAGLLCCGEEEWLARIGTVDEWVKSGILTDPDYHWKFIVPNLMKTRRVYAPDGRMLRDKVGNPSIRLLINTQPRCYVVLDFDQGTHDEQTGLLAYLSQRGPLVMVVDSGGKSLHAWFSARGASEAELVSFFRLACRLGADPSKWPLNGYVRLPGGYRNEKKKRQRIIYFDPKQI